MSNTFDRLLRAAMELHPDKVTNKSGLAVLLGESPQTITNWQKRGVPPAKVTAAARAVGVSAEWLDTGAGPMVAPDLGPAIQTPLRPVVLVDADDDTPDGAILVPRYTLKASAGNGAPVLEVDTRGAPNLCRKGWARERGYKPENLFSIVAIGDSMEPTIPNGASLIVHRQTEVVNGRPHVICRGDECFVKRLYKQMDGSILIHSDNEKMYKDITVTKDDPDELHIVGLVATVSYNPE